MSPGEAKRNGPSRTEGGQSGDEREENTLQEPYHSMVVELASVKALDVLRGDRWRTRLEAIGLSSAVVILLIAIGGFLSNEVLDARVSKHIESIIYNELENSNYRMELAFLRLKADRLSNAERGISDETLEEMVDITRLVLNKFIKNTELPVAITQERTQDIRPTLAIFINLSAQIDRGDYVNKFHDLAPDIVKGSDEVTQTLVQHTGRRLIGESGAPKVWFNEDGKPTNEYQRYRTFSERARNTGFPEVFLAFELVMRHMQEKPRKELIGLIADAETLNDRDMQHFIDLMLAHATGDFTTSPDAASERVINHYRGFLEKYQNDSELIAQILQLSDDSLSRLLQS